MTMIILMDRRAALVRAWRRAFAETPVTIRHGNLLHAATGATLISPANSFGWMDGGFDDVIRRAYQQAGVDIMTRVQRAIATQTDGELLVGQALVIPTPEGPFTYLICAPTMRTPGPVPLSANAYLAFRAILLTVRAWNQAHPAAPLPPLYVPGLATGAGLMPAWRAAQQMRRAWDTVQTPQTPSHSETVTSTAR